MKRFTTVLMLLLGVFSVFAICACEENPNTVDSSHEHVYGEWSTEKEATCTLAGTRVRVCACGEKEEETIPAKGHAFAEEFTIDTDSTCSAEGQKSKHCTRPGCNATTEAEAIPKIDHIYGNWEETKPATCTEAGKSERKCYNCDSTESKDLEPLGHDFEGSTVTKEATCTEAGIQSGGLCTRCQTPGEDVPIPKLGHDFKGEEKVTKEPTCTEKGEKTVQCTRCDEKKTQTVPAAGHAWEVTNEDAANACGDKKTEYSCKVCHETKTDIVEGKNHQWTDYTFYSGAYCSADGKKEIRTCTVCHREDIKTTPATGRHYSGTVYYVYKEPTATSEGIRYKLCSTCGEIMNETREIIPAIKDVTGEITYSVQVCRDVTANVEFNGEFTVNVYDGSTLKATVTTENALATFTLPAKTYTVKLDKLPEGYTAKSEGYTLTAAMPQINAEVSAAVIKDDKMNEKGYYQVGDVIHDFTFKDYDDKEYKMSELLEEHKFIVFDYYFTGCQYCNNEFAAEQKQGLDTRYGDDILVVYICGRFTGGESKTTVENHAKRYGLKGIFVNGESTEYTENKENLKNHFQNRINNTVKEWGYPTKIIIDQQGVYTYVARGDTYGTMYSTYESLLTMEKVYRENLHMPEKYIPTDPETSGE